MNELNDANTPSILEPMQEENAFNQPLEMADIKDGSYGFITKKITNLIKKVIKKKEKEDEDEPMDFIPSAGTTIFPEEKIKQQSSGPYINCSGISSSPFGSFVSGTTVFAKNDFKLPTTGNAFENPYMQPENKHTCVVPMAFMKDFVELSEFFHNHYLNCEHKYDFDPPQEAGKLRQYELLRDYIKRYL